MDTYITLLNQALSDRNSIWTFYTIIVTTALGTAFTPSYRQLGILPRLILTIAVGTAIWFNFYTAIINSMYVAELAQFIRDSTTDPNIELLFSTTNRLYYDQDAQLFGAIFYIYVPINFTVFFAMWWDELLLFRNYIKNKFNPVTNLSN